MTDDMIWFDMTAKRELVHGVSFPIYIDMSYDFLQINAQQNQIRMVIAFKHVKNADF